jgi:hypothetical protein
MLTTLKIRHINDILKEEPDGFNVLIQYDKIKRSIGFTSFGSTHKQIVTGQNVGEQIQKLITYSNQIIIPK